MNTVAQLPCNACGHRHLIDQYKPRSMVRTLVARDGVPAGSVGQVREWSQYGGPLYYRVKCDGWRSESYAPCELCDVAAVPNGGLRRLGVAVAVWGAMEAARREALDDSRLRSRLARCREDLMFETERAFRMHRIALDLAAELASEQASRRKRDLLLRARRERSTYPVWMTDMLYWRFSRRQCLQRPADWGRTWWLGRSIAGPRGVLP